MIPLTFYKWRRKRDSNPRGCYTLSVFKTDPFNQAWVFLQKYGGPGQGRTADTWIFSPLLYLLSYRTIFFFINKLAVSTGLEPAISSVTDWHVNHYTTRPLMVAEVRLELTTSGLWARRAANCSTPRYIT